MKRQTWALLCPRHSGTAVIDSCGGTGSGGAGSGSWRDRKCLLCRGRRDVTGRPNRKQETTEMTTPPDLWPAGSRHQRERETHGWNETTVGLVFPRISSHRCPENTLNRDKAVVGDPLRGHRVHKCGSEHHVHLRCKKKYFFWSGDGFTKKGLQLLRHLLQGLNHSNTALIIFPVESPGFF